MMWQMMPIGFGWGWMMIFWVLLWTGIIALIVWGVRRLTGRSMHRDSALDIAKERYARGEISQEEFERIKKNLL